MASRDDFLEQTKPKLVWDISIKELLSENFQSRQKILVLTAKNAYQITMHFSIQDYFVADQFDYEIYIEDLKSMKESDELNKLYDQIIKALPVGNSKSPNFQKFLSKDKKGFFIKYQLRDFYDGRMLTVFNILLQFINSEDISKKVDFLLDIFKQNTAIFSGVGGISDKSKEKLVSECFKVQVKNFILQSLSGITLDVGVDEEFLEEVARIAPFICLIMEGPQKNRTDNGYYCVALAHKEIIEASLKHLRKIESPSSRGDRKLNDEKLQKKFSQSIFYQAAQKPVSPPIQDIMTVLISLIKSSLYFFKKSNIEDPHIYSAMASLNEDLVILYGKVSGNKVSGNQEDITRSILCSLDCAYQSKWMNSSEIHASFARMHSAYRSNSRSNFLRGELEAEPPKVDFLEGEQDPLNSSLSPYFALSKAMNQGVRLDQLGKELSQMEEELHQMEQGLQKMEQDL